MLISCPKWSEWTGRIYIIVYGTALYITLIEISSPDERTAEVVNEWSGTRFSYFLVNWKTQEKCLSEQSSLLRDWQWIANSVGRR